MSAVAFDLDGCLIDSVGGILPSVRVALVAEGLPALPDDDLRFLIGPPLLTGFEELLARLGHGTERAPALVDAYRRDYLEHMVERTSVFPGLAEVLDEVHRSRGACIVTSKPKAVADPLVEALGLTSSIAFLEGPPLQGDEPKTVTLGRALERLEIGVMVGDRHHDVDAGHAHGLRTVGVLWGQGTTTELAGADRLVATPAELLEVLA